jgi:AraC-like DNA-binding protein
MEQKIKKTIPLHQLRFEQPERVPFSLLSLERYQRAHKAFPHHRHQFYEVIIVIKGSGIHQIDFENYPLGNGMLYFLTPGQVHNLRDGHIEEGSILIFDQEFIYKDNGDLALLQSLSLFYNRQPYILMDEKHWQELLPCLAILNSENHRNEPNAEILRMALKILLMQALRIQQQTAKGFIELLELIEQHFRKEHSVGFYAESLHLHPKRLNELTIALSGVRSHGLISRRILTEAKRELFYSEQSIKEIAYGLGFEDVSYFSKFFKRHTGQPPGQFLATRPKTTT